MLTILWQGFALERGTFWSIHALKHQNQDFLPNFSKYHCIVQVKQRNPTPTLSKQSKSTQAIHQELNPCLDLFIDTKALVVMSTVCLSSSSHINC